MSIDEVRSLVAERQRYESWLIALDARRAETPSRVFNRVRLDYAARRDAVVAHLAEHIGVLSSHCDALNRQLTALETELATREDERVEAMLRTAVGEYDDDRWTVVRQDVEAKIAALGAQRSGLRAEVDEIRMILASANGASPIEPIGTAGVEHEYKRVVEPVVQPQVQPVVEQEVEPQPSTEQGTPEEFADALAIFTEPADTRESILVKSLEGIEVEFDRSPSEATADIDDGFEDLAFLRAPIAPAPPSPVAAVPPPGNAPQKTLRCTECTTMNLPTEWYCERCGGELAAF